jgi:predicted alpha/beta superfamily hydrolase
MKLIGAIIVVLVATIVWAQAPAPRVTLEHTAQYSLNSKATGRTYDIMISLPRDYEQSARKYPVLYVLDGWHFPLMDFIQDNSIYSKRMPPVIIVVIGHGDPPDLMDVRAQDFHAPSLEANVKSGHADRFLDFFEHQLIPFIDSRYRTVESDRALLGHSSGGVFAIYALTERPSLFQRIVCVSPYFGPIRDHMFRAVREHLKNLPSPVVLDLSAGTEADETEGTVAFAALLDSIKPVNLRYRLTVFNGENHNSVRLSAFPSGLYWAYR